MCIGRLDTFNRDTRRRRETSISIPSPIRTPNATSIHDNHIPYVRRNHLDINTPFPFSTQVHTRLAYLSRVNSRNPPFLSYLSNPIPFCAAVAGKTPFPPLSMSILEEHSLHVFPWPPALQLAPAPIGDLVEPGDQE